MDPTLIVVVAVVAVGILYVAARRATTIALLEIRDGRIQVLHGGIAPSVLSGLGDVVRRPPIRAARVRIVRASGRAEVTSTGDASPAQVQQIRNVTGACPREVDQRPSSPMTSARSRFPRARPYEHGEGRASRGGAALAP